LIEFGTATIRTKAMYWWFAGNACAALDATACSITGITEGFCASLRNKGQFADSAISLELPRWCSEWSMQSTECPPSFSLAKGNTCFTGIKFAFAVGADFSHRASIMPVSN